MPTGRPADNGDANDNGLHPVAPAGEGARRSRRDALLCSVAARAFDDDPEFERYGNAHGVAGIVAEPVPPPHTVPPGERAPADYLFAFENDPHDPDDVFARLRWGGQFVYASKHGRRVDEMNERFGQRGFETMPRPGVIREPLPLFGLRLPLLSKKLHYFVARKVNLVLPRQFSDRFTYHLQLVPADRPARGYVVLKEVPSVARVMARLKSKFPDATTDLLEKRAQKFTEKIFPLFLTREAALLQILERDLPAAYARRIPRVVGMDKDARGYVRRLKMTWLRVGSPRPLTQLEFAKQAFDLLQLVHERVGVIHLDLRLDNMVITDHGVGFIDFGSSVRVGENIQGNPLLANLYDELMRTSQIQRMIEKMTLSGAVTSQLIQGAYGRVDKQVDLFYLAMQMVQPLNNPDFRGLVEFDPTSREAQALSALKEQVLKPPDPQNPTYRNAPDVLRAILAIEQELKGRPMRRMAAATVTVFR